MSESALFHGFCDEAGKFSLDFPAAFKAYLAKRFKGEEVTLEVYKRRTKRSDKQNRALHAMLKPWCDEGHYIDDLKLDLLKAVFGTKERISPITGEVEHVPNKPHTSQLTTAEFVELMEQAVILAAGCGVILELPDEYNKRKAQAARKRGRDA